MGSKRQVSYNVLDRSKVIAFHRRLAVVAGLGPFSDAINQFAASSALVAVPILFHFSAILTSLVIGAYFAGVGAGGFIGGILTDTYGRKRIFIYDTLGMAIFALLSAAALNGIWFLITRSLLGFFIGMDYTAAVPLLSEYAPSKDRGRLLTIEALMFKVGEEFIILLGALLTIVVGVLSAWRYTFIVGAVPVLLAFFLRRSFPESLRWSVESGRKDKVRETIDTLRRQGLEQEVRDEELGSPYGVKDVLLEFFSRRNVRALLYIFWIGTSYALTIPLVAAWSPVILEALGASATLSLIGTAIISAAAIVGVGVVMIYIDKIGRRLIGTVGYILSAIIMGIVYSSYVFHFVSIDLIIALFTIFMGINVGTIGSLQYVPPAEVTSTKVRGLTVGWDKLFEFEIALAALSIYAVLGPMNSTLFVTVASIISAIIIYLVSFETKQKPLEQISSA
ncbi:MFS transporter [Sulfodiicoccus acidiphilus]|uniref:MFS transporter n=1 Tax=Sulfodiicoccus acidiphilus TaxID=1670455 RepID=UPI001315597C|nr:MFS transporter [Sulfodiicoccus acidiphilus]